MDAVAILNPDRMVYVSAIQDLAEISRILRRKGIGAEEAWARPVPAMWRL